MSDRWDDLRFNAAEGEWAERPLEDMRRALADLLAERDALAVENERLRTALRKIHGSALAIDADHNADEYGNGCRICSPQDGGWPCIVRMEVDDVLDALTALTEEDGRD